MRGAEEVSGEGHAAGLASTVLTELPISAKSMEPASPRPPLPFRWHIFSVVNVILGMTTAGQVRRNVDLFHREVPSALWSDLRDARLLRPERRCPHRRNSDSSQTSFLTLHDAGARPTYYDLATVTRHRLVGSGLGRFGARG